MSKTISQKLPKEETMTKAKTNRLLLLGVLLIALLTMAMGFGISANAEEEVLGTGLIVTATNSGETLIYGEDYTYPANTGLTILSDKAVTIANSDPTAPTSDRIFVDSGVDANITFNGVNIDSSSAAFYISSNSTGDVTITLAEGTENILKSGQSSAGLNKSGISDNAGTLTIQGTGSLTAIGGESSAGIGGSYMNGARNIVIKGGNITAQGGFECGAGIGGGLNGSASDIIITGGSVKAVGGEFYGYYGADIGGGGKSGDVINPITANGTPVTPTLEDGTTPVYLFEIANESDADIVIDGVDFPDKHGDEKKIYAYLSAAYHTVQIGDTSTLYGYIDGAFSKVTEGTDFVVTATNSGETLVFGTDYTYTDVLTVLSDKAITIANAQGVDVTDNCIVVADGVSANITLAGVNIDVFEQDYTAAFQIAENSTGNVTITLADGTTNTLKSGGGCAGLQKNGEYSETLGKLTITGTGTLTATGGIGGAGIGGGNGGNGSYIEISGGVVTATGGDIAAGIGGGSYGSAANITITDKAVVTATGGDGGAGIGGGRNGDLEDIIISGGSVKAVGSTKGGYYAPAIGSGVTSEDGYYYDGAYVIPRLADGRTLGYLLEISNPNGEDIVINGVDFPDSHGSETKIYAYVAGTFHTVKVGDTSTVYEYYNGAFTEMVHGTDLSVSATNSGETLEHGVDYTYSSATGILTVLTDKAITIANADGVDETDDRIFVADGIDADITLAGVNINTSSGAAFAIADNSTGDVTVTLADGSVNTLVSGNNYAGLQKNGADENVGTLTICGTGSLSAQGGTDSAGIGGANNSSTGNITISGGVVVTATGGVGSAGIGGGYGGSAEDITITDNAVVTATGGAGIGGGKRGSATDIKITDKAVVTASGKDGGAGIGGGVDGTLEDIIINGGSVNAIGSYYYEETVGGADGANIGGGVILPPDPYSEPEEGAPVTPTLADGTTPVYLLELDNPNGEDISIDGVDFPDKHGDEKKIYAYVTGKNHIVKFNDTAYLYVFSDGSFAFEDEVKAPTLKVPTTTGKSVGLSWNDLGDTVSYEVYRSATGSDFVKIATADGTSYSDTNVVAGNRYYYQIKAYYSEYDVYVVSDIERVTVLDAPVITKATYGDGTVTLVWDEVPGADSYIVYHADSIGYTTMTVCDTVSATTITLEGLPKGHYLIVEAIDTETGSEGPFSEPVCVTEPVMGKITATARNGKITLTWDEVYGASKYAVYILENGSYVCKSNNVTGTSYTFTGLKNGTKYSFRVKPCAYGAWRTASVTVSATPTSPVPADISTTGGNGKVTMTWGKVAGATKYAVYMLENGSYVCKSNAVAGTSYTFTGLVNGTKYSFRVKAYVDGAWQTASGTVYGTPVAPVPTNIRTTGDNGKVTMTWSAVNGATKYAVYMLENGSYVCKSNAVAGTSYTFTGLTNGTKYSFRVKAYVNGAWQTASGTVYGTPVA